MWTSSNSTLRLGTTPRLPYPTTRPANPRISGCPGMWSTIIPQAFAPNVGAVIRPPAFCTKFSLEFQTEHEARGGECRYRWFTRGHKPRGRRKAGVVENGTNTVQGKSVFSLRCAISCRRIWRYYLELDAMLVRPSKLAVELHSAVKAHIQRFLLSRFQSAPCIYPSLQVLMLTLCLSDANLLQKQSDRPLLA